MYTNYWEIFSKNIGVITREEQMKLAEAKIAVIGCGGIGGAVIEMLARAGIQNFILSDGDKFEPSNLNRQIIGTAKDLKKSKSKTAASRIKGINPKAEVRIFGELNEKNAEKILKGSEIAVDGLDNAVGRVIVSRTARKMKIPFVFGAADRNIGMTTIFTDVDYEKFFHLPSARKQLTNKLKERLWSYQRCGAVLGVLPNIIGCFEALQCIKLLLGKQVIKAPKILYIDIRKANPFSIKRF